MKSLLFLIYSANWSFYTWLLLVSTIAFFYVMFSVIRYVYQPNNKARYQQHAMIPFEDDEQAASSVKSRDSHFIKMDF